MGEGQGFELSTAPGPLCQEVDQFPPYPRITRFRESVTEFSEACPKWPYIQHVQSPSFFLPIIRISYMYGEFCKL